MLYFVAHYAYFSCMSKFNFRRHQELVASGEYFAWSGRVEIWVRCEQLTANYVQHLKMIKYCPMLHTNISYKTAYSWW